MLASGSAIAWPPNVKRELQGWAAQRERITLRQFARLIEFATAEERDAVLAAWAGEQQRIAVETVVVVRCINATMLDALMNSARFKPYLRVRLAPDVALVDVDKLALFKAELKWAGLETEVISFGVR